MSISFLEFTNNGNESLYEDLYCRYPYFEKEENDNQVINIDFNPNSQNNEDSTSESNINKNCYLIDNNFCENSELIEPQPEKKIKSQMETKEKKHDKYCKDNLMRKLKTNIMRFVLKMLNNSLNNKSYKFYQIDKSISENLEKKFNIELLDRTIDNIYRTSKICKIYLQRNNPPSNVQLIDIIKSDDDEKKVKEILNMKFSDILKEIRENYYEKFFEKIEEKAKRKNPINIKEYMNSIKMLFMNYESWFKNKIGRNRKNNKNK